MILLTVNIRLYQAQLLLYYIHLYLLVEKDKDLDELGPGVRHASLRRTSGFTFNLEDLNQKKS